MTTVRPLLTAVLTALALIAMWPALIGCTLPTLALIGGSTFAALHWCVWYG